MKNRQRHVIVLCTLLALFAAVVVLAASTGISGRVSDERQSRHIVRTLVDAGFAEVSSRIDEHHLTIAIKAVLPPEADIATAAAALADPPAQSLTSIAVDCGDTLVWIRTYQQPTRAQPSAGLIERLLEEGRNGSVAAIQVDNRDPLSTESDIIVTRRIEGLDALTAVHLLESQRSGFGALDRIDVTSLAGGMPVEVNVTAEHADATAVLLSRLGIIRADSVLPTNNDLITVTTVNDLLVVHIDPIRNSISPSRDAKRHLEELPELPVDDYVIRCGPCRMRADRAVTCQ